MSMNPRWFAHSFRTVNGAIATVYANFAKAARSLCLGCWKIIEIYLIIHGATQPLRVTWYHAVKELYSKKILIHGLNIFVTVPTTTAYAGRSSRSLTVAV